MMDWHPVGGVKYSYPPVYTIAKKLDLRTGPYQHKLAGMDLTLT